MNYPQSAEILEKIKKSNKILLNCHYHPDSDSVATATTLRKYLLSQNKKVEIICPTSVPKSLDFIDNADKILTTDPTTFNYQGFDLFIITDSSNWDRVSPKFVNSPPEIETIVIDNHVSNKSFGDLNLLDFNSSSVSEMFYFLLEDFNFAIDQKIATALYAGLLGDTGGFQYEVYDRTFGVAEKLERLGADRELIWLNIFNTRSFELVKTWGQLLLNLQKDLEHKFVWSTFSYEEFVKLNAPEGARDSAAVLFSRVVEGTNFGMIMIEESQRRITISLRSRIKDFNVADIAVELGGGGHKNAAGATLENMDFDSAVAKVLAVARKYANASTSN